MRHYDRADVRHLNDSERYRDYDYLAEDGWPVGPEPLSMVQPPAAAPVRELESPPMWRLIIAALVSPRRSFLRALGRT
jgi:hypothetical protein